MLKKFGSLMIDPETVSAVSCGADPEVCIRSPQGHLATIYISEESAEALLKHFTEEQEKAGVVVFNARFSESKPRFTVSENPPGILDRESPGFYAPIASSSDREFYCESLNSGNRVFGDLHWEPSKEQSRPRFTVSKDPCGVLDSLRPGFIAEFPSPSMSLAMASELNAGGRRSADFVWSELPEPPPAQDEWPPETTIAWHVRAMKETVSAYERCLQPDGKFVVPARMKCEIRLGDEWEALKHPAFSSIRDIYYRLVPVE